MKNLKFVFIALLICFFSGKIKAQTDSTKKDTTTATISKEKLRMARLYYSLVAGVAISGNMFGASFNYVLSNNWGINASYRMHMRVAEELPIDYSPGFTIFSDGRPDDYLHTISLRLSREIPTSSQEVRFALESGISIVEYQRCNFYKSTASGWFGSNYGYTRTNKISVGLSLRAKTEIIFGRKFGMEVATIANINQFQSYFGGEIALNFGMLRRKIVQ